MWLCVCLCDDACRQLGVYIYIYKFGIQSSITHTLSPGVHCNSTLFPTCWEAIQNNVMDWHVWDCRVTTFRVQARGNWWRRLWPRLPMWFSSSSTIQQHFYQITTRTGEWVKKNAFLLPNKLLKIITLINYRMSCPNYNMVLLFIFYQ